MRKVTRKIIAVPVVLFLIAVLAAPMLTIHHVHRIETSEHADHISAEGSQGVTGVPQTYHETHFVTLLSGDSFNSSTRSNGMQSLHDLIATLPVFRISSSTPSLSLIASADIRPLSQLSGDKCVLFRSLLI